MWYQLYKKELLRASDFQPHQKRTVTKYILPSLTAKLCESNKSVQSPDHLKMQIQGLLFFLYNTTFSNLRSTDTFCLHVFYQITYKTGRLGNCRF